MTSSSVVQYGGGGGRSSAEVWLNVAEKPSVAKEAALILSRRQMTTAPSASRFNPNFEFRWHNVPMIFTSVAGHLTEDEFPPSTKNWAGFPMEQLFHVPITRTVKEDLKPVKKNLETLAKRSTHVILWLDCDREGENICFEVLDVVLAVNRRLIVKRAKFSALTERDLEHAMATLQEPNRRLSDAVEARREMDLRIGAAFTRLQTIRFRDRFPGMPKLISFGPCQFPTLGFLVQRHWQQEAFEPEAFYHATMTHEGATFRWEFGQIYDQLTAVVLFEEMLEAGATSSSSSSSTAPFSSTVAVATVRDVFRRPTHRNPPVPLNTVELQKLAAQHLKISAEQCMTLAEALYQQGFVSYPRTETDVFTYTDEELMQLARVQCNHGDIGPFLHRLLGDHHDNHHANSEEGRGGGGYRRPRNGGHNDNAHPPIHPLKPMGPDGGGGQWSPQHVKLHDLIVRHFIACMSPPAVAASTRVTAVLGGVTFTANGQTIMERGWLEVYPYERWSSSAHVPNYEPGQTFQPQSLDLHEGQTQTPSFVSESQLITLMDKNGIGTDATIAQHIKTVVDREYVKRSDGGGGALKPTPVGLALAAAYEAAGLEDLIRPSLRAQMELAMNDIAAGTATKAQVVAAAVKMYEGIFKQLVERLPQFEAELAARLGGGNTNDATASASTASSSAAIVVVDPSRLTVLQSSFSVCGICDHPMALMQQQHDDSGGNGGGPPFLAAFLHCKHCSRQAAPPRPQPPLLTTATASDFFYYRVPFSRVLQLTAHTQRCPMCRFGVVQVTNTEKNSNYAVCPKCFSAPPPAMLQDLESIGALSAATGDTSMRCFQCLHESCSLARGLEQVPITPCPSCRSQTLRLRGSLNGGHRSLVCGGGGCGFTVTLPNADAVVPHTRGQRCDVCGAVKLTFRFSAVQRIPGVDPEESLCVACDGRLREYLTVRGGTGHNAEQPAAAAAAAPVVEYQMPTVNAAGRGGGRGGSGGARGRGSGRGTGAAASGQHQPQQNTSCDCGAPAKRLVSKQAASAGRPFLTCGNNRACGFFQWIE